MPTSREGHPVGEQSIAYACNSKIRVWDRFVRFFHWSLVLSFALSYWSIQAGKLELHVLIGYFLAGLIVSRLLWGFYGTRHARFSDFIHSPATTLQYLKTIAIGHPRRFLGHNPAGGVMVAALLAVLAVISITGLAVLAVIDFDGPLLSLTHAVNDQQAFAVREAHALAVNVILAMVSIHLLGVLLTSYQHKENLVRAMITGDKDAGGETKASSTAQPEAKTPQLPTYFADPEKILTHPQQPKSIKNN
jgi:cytochrome b